MRTVDLRMVYRDFVGEESQLTISEEVYEALVASPRRDEERQRKRNRRYRADTEYREGETDGRLFVRPYSVEELVLRQETARELAAAISRLEDAQRRRLALHYVQGITMEDIAKAEGVSRPAVSKSVGKALAHMKTFLV